MNVRRCVTCVKLSLIPYNK